MVHVRLAAAVGIVALTAASALVACSSPPAGSSDSGSVDVSTTDGAMDASGGNLDAQAPAIDGMVPACGMGDSDAGLYANLDFQSSALGTYDCPTTNSIPSPPAPWPAGECQGVGSEIIVYSSGTDAGFPAPICGDGAAAFESADPDTQTQVARIQVHRNVPMPQADAGTELYASYYLYAPSSLPPPVKSGQGLTLFQEWYGPPFDSGPAVPFSIYAMSNAPITNGWYLRRSDPLGWPLYEVPLQEDTWIKIVDHIILSSDPSIGLLETWINGVKQTFTGLPRVSPQIATYRTDNQSMSADHQTLHIATMTTDQTGTMFTINNYRHVNNGTNPIGPGTLTLFFSGVRIGTTYASVAP